MSKDQALSAPAHPDTDILVGGPGGSIAPDDAAEQASIQAANRKKVKISGAEYEVDDQLASALEEREREFQRKLTDQAEDLRARYQPIHQPPIQSRQVVEDPDKELDTLWFENPRKAAERIKQDVINQVASAYTARENERQFWSDFYTSNEDLKPFDVVSKALLQQHFGEWSHLSPARAQRELAVVVRDYVARFRVQSEPAESQTRRTKVEPGNSAPRPKPAAPPQTAPKSLSEMLAARKASRRQPATAR